MILYAWLSGMNVKTVNTWSEITLGIFCLIYSGMLFRFCDYAHHFANIVRYQRILFKHVQSETKKRELLKTPTKIEEIKKKIIGRN